MAIKDAALESSHGQPTIHFDADDNSVARYSIGIWSRPLKRYIEQVAINHLTGDEIPDEFNVATPVAQLKGCLLVCHAVVGTRQAAKRDVSVELYLSQGGVRCESSELFQDKLAKGKVAEVDIKLNLEVS